MDYNRAAPVNSMLQPRPMTAGQQLPYAQNGPPVPRQSGLQQPWGPPPPHPPQAPQLPVNFQQAGHPPMHSFPGGPHVGEEHEWYTYHCMLVTAALHCSNAALLPMLNQHPCLLSVASELQQPRSPYC